MNWLAKNNFNTIPGRLGPFRLTILILALVGLCVYCGYRLGNRFHSFQVQTLEQQKARLDDYYARQVEYVRQINTLEAELAFERLANQGTQDSLKEMGEKHYQLKKELAFYEKVMAPEKQADGLVIDQVSVTPTESPNHYRFQVVLVQQVLKKRYAKGFVELALSGSLNDKPSEIKLADISTLKREDLKFSFQYFQVIEGEFTLPEAFVPEKVEVAAILPKGKWQKYRRLDESYPWPMIVKNDLQTSTLILD
ncbi:DUF6776 family protein [Thalassomonas sp. RHCl1]|uniref:DUF6776 family protein n=1 Tax=Thalassomonas sp. RHCl1 TaxID=2995320 RepID=UPI00248B1E25|nr:DUF6776 family protein [Thalassomonas sp. RHCl1]